MTLRNSSAQHKSRTNARRLAQVFCVLKTTSLLVTARPETMAGRLQKNTKTIIIVDTRPCGCRSGGMDQVQCEVKYSWNLSVQLLHTSHFRTFSMSNAKDHGAVAAIGAVELGGCRRSLGSISDEFCRIVMYMIAVRLHVCVSESFSSLQCQSSRKRCISIHATRQHLP